MSTEVEYFNHFRHMHQEQVSQCHWVRSSFYLKKTSPFLGRFWDYKFCYLQESGNAPEKVEIPRKKIGHTPG